jgi:hypothetical protein
VVVAIKALYILIFNQNLADAAAQPILLFKAVAQRCQQVVKEIKKQHCRTSNAPS